MITSINELIGMIPPEKLALIKLILGYMREGLDVLNIGFTYFFLFVLGLAFIISVIYYFMYLYNLFNKTSPEEKPLKEKEAPFVTIQIPTFNELAALNCAENCLAFDYPKDRYEILIGDDSNDPSVSAKLLAFANKHSQVSVHKRASNIGYKPGNLNNMLKYSNGEILVLFDSDFLPEKDFLRRIIAPFQYSDVSVVQARWKPINPSLNLITILAGTMSKVFHHLVVPFAQNFSKVAFLLGSAEAIRKKDLIEVGGWSTGCLTEDIECTLRLLLKGKKLVYLPKLECRCEVPFTPIDLYKQQMRWAYGVVLSFKTHYRALVKSSLGIKEHFGLFLFASGYAFSPLLGGLFIFGVLSFVTHPPGPIDLARFAIETSRNIALSSGLLFTSLFITAKDPELWRLDKLIFASFTYGIVVTYYVNVGIFRVITGKPMPWFMLKKKGNEVS